MIVYIALHGPMFMAVDSVVMVTPSYGSLVLKNGSTVFYAWSGKPFGCCAVWLPRCASELFDPLCFCVPWY